MNRNNGFALSIATVVRGSNRRWETTPFVDARSTLKLGAVAERWSTVKGSMRELSQQWRVCVGFCAVLGNHVLLLAKRVGDGHWWRRRRRFATGDGLSAGRKYTRRVGWIPQAGSTRSNRQLEVGCAFIEREWRRPGWLTRERHRV